MNDYKQDANIIARELMYYNSDFTQEELSEAYYERIHEHADNAVIYYDDAQAIIDSAWGSDERAAEDYLAGIWGNGPYDGCESMNDCRARLAYALVYCALEEAACDACDAAWEWRHDYRFRVNLDERGEYSADVIDYQDATIVEIDGAKLESLIEDGFMAHRDDLDGLIAHLKELGFVSEDALLTTVGV